MNKYQIANYLLVFALIASIIGIYLYLNNKFNSVINVNLAEQIAEEFKKNKKNLLSNYTDNEIKKIVEEKADKIRQAFKASGENKKSFKNKIPEIIRKYESKEKDIYFFAYTYDCKNIFHGAEKLEGANLCLTSQNVKRKNVVENLIALAKEKGEGFDEYLWSQPSKSGETLSHKRAYIVALPELEIFVGSGIYPKEIFDLMSSIHTTTIETAKKVNRNAHEDFKKHLEFSILVLLVIFLLIYLWLKKNFYNKGKEEGEEKGKAKAKREFAIKLHRDINNDLDKVSSRIKDLINELQNKGVPISSNQLKESLVGIQKITEKINNRVKNLRKFYQPETIDERITKNIQVDLYYFSEEYPTINFVELDKQGVIDRLPELATDLLPGIVRESIRNAIKHGKPNTITVRLKGEDNQVMLQIIDDGIGINKDTIEEPWKRDSVGQGLKDMEEEMAAIKGTFNFELNKPHGTIITAIAPKLINKEVHQ